MVPWVACIGAKIPHLAVSGPMCCMRHCFLKKASQKWFREHVGFLTARLDMFNFYAAHFYQVLDELLSDINTFA